jgi:hypothetical protein
MIEVRSNILVITLSVNDLIISIKRQTAIDLAKTILNICCFKQNGTEEGERHR